MTIVVQSIVLLFLIPGGIIREIRGRILRKYHKTVVEEYESTGRMYK